MKPVWIAAASIFSLVSATAHAQEDAGVSDAEPGDAGIADIEDAPPTAGSLAPPIDTRFRAATVKRYEIMLGSGVILEVVGVVTLITSFSFAMGAARAFNSCNVEMGVAGCEEEAAKHKERARTVAWVTLTVGIVAVAVGVPLLVKGAKGHHRMQRYLGREEEIPRAAHLTGLTLAAFHSRDGPAGGLVLSGSF